MAEREHGHHFFRRKHKKPWPESRIERAKYSGKVALLAGTAGVIIGTETIFTAGAGLIVTGAMLMYLAHRKEKQHHAH